MLFSNRHGARLLALTLLLLLTACGGGGGGGSTTSNPSLSRIEVTPSQPSLAKGTALTLTATGIYSDNNRRALTDEVTWLSSNNTTATVSVNGEIAALNAGLVTVQASLDGITGNTELTITNATLSWLELNPDSVQLAKGTRHQLALIGHYSDGSTQDVSEQANWIITDNSIASLPDPLTADNLWLTGLTVGSTQLSVSLGAVNTQIDVDVTAASLVQLIISPDTPDLPLGTTLQLSALGLYSDGHNQDLTQQVSWNSTDSGILGVDESGLIQPLSIGSTTVTATLAGISSNRTVNISDALLTSIELSAVSNNLPLGNSQPLLALGHYSDGSLQNITEQVTWQSTPVDRLAISNAAGSRGLATAVTTGSVTVTATLGAITGTLALSNSAATLSSIDVSPLSARLAIGTQENFVATGRYSDGSIQDISEHVSWTTTDASIAATSNVANAQGQTLALTQGSTTVSATLNGVSGDATLAVTAAQLLSINVVPSGLTLPVGLRQTLHAEGNFSDGSIQILDDTVRWESDTPSTAAVNNGEINPLQPGSTRISASLDGISGNTTVTVNNATLSSLQINPSSQSLAVDTETQLQAIALYSDGSQWDATTQVIWNSADSNRLRVDNSPDRHGHLTALLSGDIIVSVSLGGVSANTTISISNAALTGFRIVASKTNLDSAESLRLTAIGDFSDGSSQDLTAKVVWRSDTPGLASVSNNAGDRGQVVAGVNVSGVAVITASYGDFSPSPTLALTINSTPKRPVSLVVLAAPNVIRNDGVDASTLEVRVQAADPNDMVLDGTAIQLQILQNDIVLESQPLVTTGGIASTSFTTTDTGLLQIQASIADPILSNSTVLYASPTINDVIVGAGFADTQNIGTLIPAGTRFGFFMFNLSNRDFALQQFELLNGGTPIFITADPADLNGNELSGGLKMGVIYTLLADITDQGIEARYYLTDPATGNPFTLVFTRP